MEPIVERSTFALYRSTLPLERNTASAPNVIEYINNIVVALKDKSDENVNYVQAYLNDWLDTVVGAKLDKSTMLPLYEAEELRAKTLQVIKKLRADLL